MEAFGTYKKERKTEVKNDKPRFDCEACEFSTDDPEAAYAHQLENGEAHNMTIDIVDREPMHNGIALGKEKYGSSK